MLENIKLNIHRVQSMDIGALREMVLALNREADFDYPVIDEAETDKHMLHVLATKDDPYMIYLIAYAGKKPVGFCLGYIGHHEWGKPGLIGVGQELYVVPNKRGGRVALRLIEKAAEIAILAGVEGLECISMYGKTDKRWEAFGFKPHLIYGHMPTAEFAKLVDKFTGSEA